MRTIKLSTACWFKRGWERAIDSRASKWNIQPIALRGKITRRYALAVCNELLASSRNVRLSDGGHET